MQRSLVIGQWSFVPGNVALVICLSAAGVCIAAPPPGAAEPKGPPPREIKFLLDDQPFVVETERTADTPRYAAVVRGFASFLVGENGRASDSTLPTIGWSDLQNLPMIIDSPAAKRIRRFAHLRNQVVTFQTRGIHDYDASEIKAPPGKHVSFSQSIGNAIAFMQSETGTPFPQLFAPAREVEHPPLQEYVFLTQSVEEAQGLARDFLDVYDQGLLGLLRKRAEDGKTRLAATRREAAPKLADLERRVAEQEEKLEGVELLEDAAISDLKVKRTLLKVDLAGVKARLGVIDKKSNDSSPLRGTGTLVRLAELKITAEIDLASLAAQQQLLDELIDGQRQLRELSQLRKRQLSPVKGLVGYADSGIERCDEILADLIPFALVNETVVIRPVKFSLPGETTPAN